MVDGGPVTECFVCCEAACPEWVEVRGGDAGGAPPVSFLVVVGGHTGCVGVMGVAVVAGFYPWSGGGLGGGSMDTVWTGWGGERGLYPSRVVCVVLRDPGPVGRRHPERVSVCGGRRR